MKHIHALLMSAALISTAVPAHAGTVQEGPTKAAAATAQLAATPPVPAASALVPSLIRAPSFAFDFRRPENPGKRLMVLLHGSGGDETTLMKLARQISPDAVLLGIRGRVTQDGVTRWYKRLTPTSFDQSDVKSEASAFVSFLKDTSAKLKLDLDNAIFLGYSNGANLIAAMSVLHPDLIHKAVLLRAMPVLEQAPQADLDYADILTIGGRSDTLYAPYAPKLEELFRSRGAHVESYMVDSGHSIGDEDARLVREWLMAGSAK